jgi:ribosomal-protein-alanine N-acetyltransferase
MPEISIREMQKQDIKEILEIERVSFTSPWSETAFLNEIDKSYALARIALFKHAVIGYICVNYILNECHILNIAVHPEFRRQGVATALMEDALMELRRKGCGFFYLEVRISNLGARRFYERFGFRVAGVRREYYISPAEDAALMMLRA